MSVTRYNFRKPKINRQEHEAINKILTHPHFNALINPKALEVLTELGISDKQFQDIINKNKSILKSYKTKEIK